MKNRVRLLIVALIGASALAACNSLEVTMPVGPQGEQGIPGKDGLSAYELWVKAIQEKQIDYSGPVDINHFFIYLKGKDGVDGKDGLNGKSAYEMWKDYVATGVDDPHNPGTQWDKSKTSMADFYWFLTGNDGADGLIPYIKDGHWWIGGTDTGVTAKGDKGDKGDSGVDGKDGVDGLDAYEMWKTYVRQTIAAGGVVADQNGNVIALEDLSILKFFQYLTGKAGAKGDKGDDGIDGKDGSDGKDGLVPEVNPKTGEWILVDKAAKDTVFTHVTAKGCDGKDGIDGKDGQTPYVGSNGNWWIGSVDTGVEAKGQKGDTGASGSDGKDGVDGKDGADGIDGKDGSDGSDGKSAYELWVADVTSQSGLEDPKNPGSKWDPTKTSVADFYEYLCGATGAKGDSGSDGVDGKDGADGKDGVDGKDGTDGKDGADGVAGKSAYEIWKELVLSASGLDNPDNGVYDKTRYPKWPKTAVSLSDFFKYLRGNKGETGVSLTAVDTLYVEDADWSKYNVAPVRALAKVKTVGSAKDTTYEYVNPHSGGCALIVSGPGPVVIPNCTVSFKDQLGNAYTKTSDASGYIYLTRDELPDWRSGCPSIHDMSARTKPLSFSYDGKTIADDGKIAATCGVPYKVEIGVKMVGSEWIRESVYADYEIFRIVEGATESSWDGVRFPETNANGSGYYLYRSLGDMDRIRKVNFSSSISIGDYAIGDHFLKVINPGVDCFWDRPVGTEASTMTKQLSFGNGEEPRQVSVNYLPVRKKDYDNTEYYLPLLDYGQQCVSSTKTIVPEYCGIGAFNVTALKGGSGDEAFTSYNDKLVMSDDGMSKVQVNKTNYELILGQTSFSFSFDYSTFGHVYLRDAYYDSATDTYRFKRYDSLKEYVEDTNLTVDKAHVGALTNSGSLAGVKVNNRVLIYFSAKNGTIVELAPYIIRNVYDNFTIEVPLFSFEDVYYGRSTGTFSYDESNPYVASCEIGGSKCTFQAIKDARSAPMP